MSLTELVKHSMKWSIARSLCDSWASCSHPLYITTILLGGKMASNIFGLLSSQPSQMVRLQYGVTESSPVAERLRDALCHWMFCLVTQGHSNRIPGNVMPPWAGCWGPLHSCSMSGAIYLPAQRNRQPARPTPHRTQAGRPLSRVTFARNIESSSH